MPRVLGDPRQPPPGGSDSVHERAAVTYAEPGGYGGLVVPREDVARTARDSLQRDAYAQDGVVRVLETGLPQRTPGDGSGESCGAQSLDVTQATTGALQIGLEEERQVP
jgi:hypothetical protein